MIQQLDIFIPGELVDLCIPTREFVLSSDWYALFNRPDLTRYLDQGLFPNTREDQLEFFERERKKRLLLVVRHKDTFVGVISLSSIDMIRKEAYMAMVIDRKKCPKTVPYVSLEAIARIVQHAMENMGLERINSGQHIDLHGWNNRKELLGFKIEGIKRRGFVKGREVADAMLSSLIWTDYQALVAQRGGLYWDGLDKMRTRMLELSQREKAGRPTFVDRLRAFLDTEGQTYYDEIFKL